MIKIREYKKEDKQAIKLVFRAGIRSQYKTWVTETLFWKPSYIFHYFYYLISLYLFQIEFHYLLAINLLLIGFITWHLSYSLDAFIKESLKSDLLNIDEYYNGKNGRFWVAINENDEICGHIGLDASLLNKNGSVELRRCSVDAKYRKHGIGKLLVEHLLDKAKSEYKAKHIFLTTTNKQRPAIRLYAKCGFKITNDNIERIFLGIKVLKLEKFLN